MQAMDMAIAVPLVLGGLSYILRKWTRLGSRIVALGGGLIAFSCCIHVWISPASSSFPLSRMPAWLAAHAVLELGSGVFQIVFRTTQLGNLVALCASIFVVLVAMYDLGGRENGDRSGFSPFLLWSLTGALIVAWSDNLLLLLLGWEVVTLCLYMMTSSRKQGATAAEKCLAVLGISDIAMLISIAFLLAAGESKGTTISSMSIEIHTPIMTSAYLLFLLAAFAKAGVFPLHTWVPAVARDSYAAVSALFPASLDKLLGIYLFARITLDVFVLGSWLRSLLLIIGAITILGAVLMAMMQHNLKRLLGFHSVSQVGYMVLGIGTGLPLGVAGALLHMLNNALYKTGLFLMAGITERYTQSSELDDLGGLGRRLRWTWICAIIFALSISGIPPSNGFLSKWMLYHATLSVGGMFGSALFMAALFGSVLTLASFIKVIHSVFSGPEPEQGNHPKVAEPVFMLIPMVLLAAGCIAIGIFAAGSIHELISPVVEEFGLNLPPLSGFQSIGLSSGIWSPVLVGGMLVCVIAVGSLIYLASGIRKARTVDTFLGGESLGRRPPFYSGTNFYLILNSLPVLGRLLKDCEAGVLDPYRWFRLMGNPILQALRRMHSGLLSLYVAWALIGLCIIVLFMVL